MMLAMIVLRLFSAPADARADHLMGKAYQDTCIGLAKSSIMFEQDPYMLGFIRFQQLKLLCDGCKHE